MATEPVPGRANWPRRSDVPVSEVEDAWPSSPSSTTTPDAASSCARSGTAGATTPVSEHADVIGRWLLEGQHGTPQPGRAGDPRRGGLPAADLARPGVGGPRRQRGRRDPHARHPRPDRGGRAATPRPERALFGTTDYFLERMGLTSLDELPPLAPHLPDAAGARGRTGRAGRTHAGSSTDRRVSEPRGHPAAEGAGPGRRRVPSRRGGPDRRGRVEVNGKVVTEQGMRVDPASRRDPGRRCPHPAPAAPRLRGAQQAPRGASRPWRTSAAGQRWPTT